MSCWDELVDWEVDGVDENSHLREGKGIKFWLPYVVKWSVGLKSVWMYSWTYA